MFLFEVEKIFSQLIFVRVCNLIETYEKEKQYPPTL